MKLSTSLNIIYGRNGEAHSPELIAKIAHAGYEGLDFNFLDIEDDIDWFDMRTAERYTETLANVVEQNNLAWVQGHAPIYNFLLTGADIERKHALCQPAIKASAALQVPWLVFHPCSSVDYNHLADRKTMLQKNRTHFQGLLKECEKYGVGMAIENMPAFDHSNPCYCHNATELSELIGSINHPLVGACLDTGHAHISGLNQQKELSILGSRLKVLHLQDNNGAGDDHLLPYTRGAGGIDWDSVAQGLITAEYSGALNLETHNSFNCVPDSLLPATMSYGIDILRAFKKAIISLR